MKKAWAAGFWRWREFSNFLKAFAAIVLFFGVITALFYGEVGLGATLGVLSAGIECTLGVPQLLLNYRLKSTAGLSRLLLLSWILGDSFRTMYYIANDLPI